MQDDTQKLARWKHFVIDHSGRFPILLWILATWNRAELLSTYFSAFRYRHVVSGRYRYAARRRPVGMPPSFAQNPRRGHAKGLFENNVFHIVSRDVSC
jgi:hypothetical protein